MSEAVRVSKVWVRTEKLDKLRLFPVTVSELASFRTDSSILASDKVRKYLNVELVPKTVRHHHDCRKLELIKKRFFRFFAEAF